MLLFLASTLDPNNPLSWVGIGSTGGLAAAVFLAFVKGWIAPGWIVERLEARIKEQDDQLQALTNVFQTQYIPALTKSTDAQEKVLDYLTDPRRRGGWGWRS